MRLCLLFLATSLFLLSEVSAQNVTDDFSDGDLLNPDWQGDLTNFVIDNEELRLMAPAAGNSTIWLPLRTATQEEIVYEFFVRLDFAPSGGNFGEVELRGLSSNNEATVYKLRIGGISGDQDALTFSVSYDGLTSEELIAATPGAVGNDPAVARVRLTRSAENLWSLEADYTGGTNYQLEGTANDPRQNPAQLDYFGFNCTYTSTRVDAFFFDDINVGPIDPDEEAPVFLSSQVLSADRILLSFNEVLIPNPAGDPGNYSFNPSSLALAAVDLVGADVELQFTTDLPIGEDIMVNVTEVADNFGNRAGPFSTTLFIEPTTIPRPSNLLITEFMADPSPVVGLPNTEYVEIYNASDTLMLIEGLTLASGGTPQAINSTQLLPRSYATIVDEEVAGEFPAEAQVVTVSSFPSLTNGGDEIELGFNGNLIQRITYTDDWYNDPTRAEGGYSLELTDLTASDLNCRGRWSASQAPAGGTPGLINSVDGLIVDEQGPQALGGVFVEGGIELRFDEELSTGQDLGAFSINPDLGITGLEALGNQRYLLQLSATAEENTIYEVLISDEIQDCVGNLASEPFTLRLGLPSEVELGDVVINEVLF
ncbi:MAG: lamin tail domain-containing protein, partial [Bacteroidota bacterium]